MSRIIHPPVDQFDRLRQPLTAGEREVARLFYRELPQKWEIYLQPHLNGLRPDIVLLNPDVGIAVFEIKDWNLDALHRWVESDHRGRPRLIAEKDGQRFEIKDNPVSQVNRYKRHIYELYCPRLAAKAGFAAITAGVIMPFADDNRARALLAPFADIKYPAYQPISGRDALARGDLQTVFPQCAWNRSNLMSEALAADLRGWLVEPEVSREQRRSLIDDLDPNQRGLASNRTQSGYRRIKGPAGSGKSLVLAARAAHLASEDKNTIVVSFNITLSNYLRDLVVRGIVRRGAGDNVVFTHFHGWCRDICERVGWEDRLAAIYALIPRLAPSANADERHKSKRDRLKVQQLIDNELLPALAIAAVKEAGGPCYDAILVDEGQDFRPAWWNALRTALHPGGEMLLVADAT